MHYFLRVIVIGFICVFVCTCGKNEKPVVAKKVIKVPVLQTSDTIYIVTRPGYMYDVRVQRDTIHHPPTPIPGPEQQINLASGQIVQIPDLKDNEIANYTFETSISERDTIHVTVFYEGSGKTVTIPCNSEELVKISCDGVMEVPCGSYIVCRDTIHVPELNQ